MIKVWVIIFTLRHVHTVRRLEVVTSQDIVDVVDSTGSHSDFREISRPDTPVGILRLIL